VKRSPKRSGPGIAKARAYPLVDARDRLAFRSVDYRWRELFETADVMSEGAVRHDRDGASYYGTTSVLLTLESRGGRIPDASLLDVVHLVERDVHARTRAVRIACREARVRSVHPISRIRAELVVHRDPRGIRIDVDVEAKVVASTRAPRARAR
jgi:hypothetical protein